jgi:hypothetical protein
MKANKSASFGHNNATHNTVSLPNCNKEQYGAVTQFVKPKGAKIKKDEGTKLPHHRTKCAVLY